MRQRAGFQIGDDLFDDGVAAVLTLGLQQRFDTVGEDAVVTPQVGVELELTGAGTQPTHPAHDQSSGDAVGPAERGVGGFGDRGVAGDDLSGVGVDLGVPPEQVAGDAGHEPDRGLLHRQGGDTADDRAGHGWLPGLRQLRAGLRGLPFLGHYAASKHGVVGLARTMANELGQFGIRVNTVHPHGVATGMSVPDMGPLMERYAATLGPIFMGTLPDPVSQPEDIAAAVAWLASDEARHFTGIQLPVDLGTLTR